VDSESKRVHTRQLTALPVTLCAVPVRLPLEEASHHRLVQRRHLEVEIRQLRTALVHKAAAVQAVIQRAEISEAECPRDEAGRRRAPRRHRDPLLPAESSHLMREQQQLGQAGGANCARFALYTLDRTRWERAA